MKKIFCLQFAWIVLLTFHSKAQGKLETKTADSLFESLYRNGQFNGNVLLAEKGKVLYKRSFGLANEATGAKIDENTLFELASVSKQFTAMAIALLQHQGKLSFDDELSRYIPGLSHYKGITIKNLIYHTSGLPDYMVLDDSVWKAWDDSKIATNKDIISMFALYKPELEFEPGTKHSYSNTNYMLLASIIEKASGQSYAAYLSRHIFKPLHMDRSCVYTRRYAPKQVANYALGYVTTDDAKKVLPDSFAQTSYVYMLDGIVGDGTVNSTVNDLLQWDQALYTDKLLPAGKRSVLFEQGKLNDGTACGYAFGWAIKDKADGTKIAAHSGGWPGYVAYIERNMKTRQLITLLQNTSKGEIPKNEIRLLMDGKPIPPPEVFTEITVPEEILASYTGKYELAPEFILSIFKEGPQLYAQATGQGKLPIYPTSATKFFTKKVKADMEFVKEGDKITKMIFHQGGGELIAPKIE